MGHRNQSVLFENFHLFKEGSVVEFFFHAGHLAQHQSLLSALFFTFNEEVGSPLALRQVKVKLEVVFWVILVFVDHDIFRVLLGRGFSHKFKKMETVGLLGHATF